MKNMTFIIAVLLFSSFSYAQQQDQPAPSTPRIEKAQKKADKDLEQAKKDAAMKEAEILLKNGELKKSLSAMEKKKRAQDTLLESLNDQYYENDKEIVRLQKRLEEQEGSMNEVSGSVRGIAQDTATTLRRSLVSGEIPNRDKNLEPLLSETEFPTLENIKKMTAVMLDEIDRNGKIVTKNITYVDATGKQAQGDVIRIGAFNAICVTGNDVSYLEYATVKQAFHQLIIPAPKHMTREAKKFSDKKSPGLYLDLSSGSAFRQLTDMPTWYDQLKAGGVLMYPLIGVGLVALILIVERLIVLMLETKNSEAFAGRISGVLQSRNWDEARKLCSGKKGSLAQVLRSGIDHRDERVEVLESVMEESIQKSLPRLERNMSALSILGMVSPLIGLLGTVTGMIATFQMITLYGTGDPKIMSGGISEALVTTQYGLIVAIPIILLHGYFQGRIDRIVGILEEKSIMLVNAVKKQTSTQEIA